MRSQLILILFLITTFNANCQNKPSKVTLASKQISNITIKKTTLDSLQGIWTSTGDKTSEIKILKDTLFYLNGKKIVEKSVFYLNHECADNKNNLSHDNLNGEFLISFSLDDDYPMCFQIDYLTLDRLIWIYNGHTVGYQKKKLESIHKQ